MPRPPFCLCTLNWSVLFLSCAALDLETVLAAFFRSLSPLDPFASAPVPLPPSRALAGRLAPSPRPTHAHAPPPLVRTHHQHFFALHHPKAPHLLTLGHAARLASPCPRAPTVRPSSHTPHPLTRQQTTMAVDIRSTAKFGAYVKDRCRVIGARLKSDGTQVRLRAVTRTPTTRALSLGVGFSLPRPHARALCSRPAACAAQRPTHWAQGGGAVAGAWLGR